MSRIPLLLRSARAQSHQHPRRPLSADALSFGAGHADSLASSRLLGALSSYAPAASGAAAFARPEIMALRTCWHSVEDWPAWDQIRSFRTDGKDVLTWFDQWGVAQCHWRCPIWHLESLL